MTGAAVAAGASAWWTAAAVAVDVAIVAGTAYSSYSSYQQGVAQAEYARQQAAAQAAAAQAQAAAQAKAENAQANIAMKQAEMAQRQGEYEAQKRGRILAADIGSQYANWAGNGLLVDGGVKDTLGDVLKTTYTEGNADINVISQNAHNNAWTAAETARVHRMNANSALGIGALNASNALALGDSQAKIAYSTGKSQAISTGISGVTTLATAGLGAYGAFSNMAASSAAAAGTAATKNVYAWNTTGGFGTSLYA